MIPLAFSAFFAVQPDDPNLTARNSRNSESFENGLHGRRSGSSVSGTNTCKLRLCYDATCPQKSFDSAFLIRRRSTQPPCRTQLIENWASVIPAARDLPWSAFKSRPGGRDRNAAARAARWWPPLPGGFPCREAAWRREQGSTR